MKIKKPAPDIHPRNKDFSQIQPFLISPGYPKDLASFWQKLVPRLQKSKLLMMKKPPLDIHPRNKCARFQSNPTIFEVSRLPQRFNLVLAKTRHQAPKIKIFEKRKKLPRIFTQGKSLQNFSQIQPFLKSLLI